MKLFRNLIYILSALFVLGVILVIVVDPTLVMSRIATGLTTGALVGLITAVVNYVNSREVFFENLTRGLRDVYIAIYDDYLIAKRDLRVLMKDSKKMIISYFDQNKKEEEVMFEKKIAKYDDLFSQIGFNTFAGLFPMDQHVSDSIDDILRFLKTDVRPLRFEYFISNKFSLLPTKKKLEEFPEGSFDLIFEELTNREKDYCDILAFTISKLARKTLQFETDCKRVIPISAKDYLNSIQESSKMHLKGVVIRDVRNEGDN